MREENISTKFENLFEVVSSTSFLKMEALGGEIPFFISTYAPKQFYEVIKAIKGLINRLESNGILVLELDLYAMTMELLNHELGEGEVFNLEKEMRSGAEFKEALQSVLDIHEVFMPAIKERIEIDTSQIR